MKPGPIQAAKMRERNEIFIKTQRWLRSGNQIMVLKPQEPPPGQWTVKPKDFREQSGIDLEYIYQNDY